MAYIQKDIDKAIYLHKESGEMVPIVIESHDWNEWFYVKQKDGTGGTLHVRSCDLYTNGRRLLSAYANLNN